MILVGLDVLRSDRLGPRLTATFAFRLTSDSVLLSSGASTQILRVTRATVFEKLIEPGPSTWALRVVLALLVDFFARMLLRFARRTFELIVSLCFTFHFLTAFLRFLFALHFWRFVICRVFSIVALLCARPF